MEGSDNCMDTNIRMEFNRLWGDLSRIDKELVLAKFKIETLNTDVKAVHTELDNHLEQKWNDLNGKKDRRNNIKIALIAVLAAGIPSIIAILTR